MKIFPISSLPFSLVNFDDLVSIEKWLKFAKRIGLDGVEIIWGWPMEWHIVQETKKILQKYNLRVSALNASRSNFFRPTKAGKETEKKIISGFVDLAMEFKTNIVVVHAGDFDPVWREISEKKALDIVGDTITTCLKYAEKNKITLALENHPGFGVRKEVLAAIFERINSGYLGWNFDSENAYRIKSQTAFDFLGDKNFINRLKYTHIKNFKDAPTGWISSVPLNKGDLNIKKMIEIIRDNNYKDWICIEYGGDNFNDLRESVHFIKEI